MAVHDTLDIASFRVVFPMFTSVVKYPDALLNGLYGFAGSYISNSDSVCGGLAGDTLDLALQLVTAHLLIIWRKANKGEVTAPLLNASIDKVSVAVQPPPTRNGWEYFLSSTPFGLQLWALLSVQSAGGWSVGGAPERSAFRRVGGRFG